jgi:hypothetical protein
VPRRPGCRGDWHTPGGPPIPERERLVHENPGLRAAIERGMADAAAGRVEGRGSLAQYLDDTDDVDFCPTCGTVVEPPAGGATDG